MINRIQAENFFSWKTLDFKIESGVTLIDGFNHDDLTSEGSGKSTILNALSWGLFGKIPKDVKINEVIREGSKSCKVCVILDEYKITRSRGPNILSIIRLSDKKELKGKDAKETQAIIEELIGLNFETFTQSIYFAQNYPKKFITSNEEDKSKILSEILGLKKFDVARKDVQELIKLEKTNILIKEKELEKDLAILENLTDSKNSLQEMIDNFNSDKELGLRNLGEKAENIQLNIAELNNQEESLREDIQELMTKKDEYSLEELNSAEDFLEEELSNLRFKLNNINHNISEKAKTEKSITNNIQKISKIYKDIEQFNNSKIKDSCPHCNKSLLEDSEYWDKAIDSAQKDIKDLEDESSLLEEFKEHIEIWDSSEIEGKINSILEAKFNIRTEKDDLSRINSNIEILESKIALNLEKMSNQKLRLEEVIKDIDFIKNSQPVDLITNLELVSGNYNDMTEELKSKFILFEESKEYLRELELLKNSFREIKSFLFINILKELSRKANNYLQELFEVPISINFINSSKEGIGKIQTVVKMNGVPRSLGLYSGGQFRRICLAVDLAISDILSDRSSNPIKLRIMDEYCKDLSESSMEKVLRLLEKFKGSTIMIEHNSLVKSIVNNIFFVELTNGVSSASKNI